MPEWCTKIPSFPSTSYMVYFSVGNGNDSSWKQPMTHIYHSTSEIKDAAIELNEEVSKHSDHEVYEEAIVIPLKFDRHILLREEYWKKPSVHYSEINRLKAFWQVTDKPSLYHLLVTPTWHKKKLFLSAALPLYASATDDVIEQFMRTSDFPIDKRAKYAGIYALGQSFRLHWETGEMIGKSPFTQKHLH